MIRRETDPDFINRIANGDTVREFIHSRGEIMDFSTAVLPPATQTGVCFLSNGEDAVSIFALTAPRVWQSHTMFAPSCRGRRAIDTGRAMVAFMFDKDWADILWGVTPRSNRKAIWFNRQIGAVIIGGDADEEVFEIRRRSGCSFG